jgi:thiol-disulfide isomerase/thioredoxin
MIAKGTDKSARWISCLAMGLACLVVTTPDQSREKLKVGDLPPQRLFRSVNLSDYRGRVVVMTFWASWCGPCRQEIPVLAGLQAQVARDKLEILAINWGEDWDKFHEIKRKLSNVDLTLLSDPDGTLGKQFDVDSIPHMLIIGKDGRIAALHVGYSADSIPVFVKEINALLAEGAANGATDSSAPNRDSSSNPEASPVQ